MTGSDRPLHVLLATDLHPPSTGGTERHVDVLDGGRAGVLVPPGDPTALRRAVVELLGDPDRAARLVAAGRRRAAALDGFDALLAIYRQLQRQAELPASRT